MGKTPMRKGNNYRTNPYNNNGTQQQQSGIMPFVVLQRYDGASTSQGYNNNRDSNYRENPYQERVMSPFVPPPQQRHYNKPPPNQSRSGGPAPRRGFPARGGYNNFVQRRQQPVPSPFHQPHQGFNHPGNHPSPMMHQHHPSPMMPQHPSPMMQHFHPPTQHRPPFPPQQQQKWHQKFANNRGKRQQRQQTPMKKAPTSMTLATNKNVGKVTKGPVRSPIKTRKSMTSMQILETTKNVQAKLTEKDTTKTEKGTKVAQRSPIKTRKSLTSTQLLADTKKTVAPTTKQVRSPIKLRKSIGPRQIIPETKKEENEKRKSLINQRKSLDTKKRLSVPGNSNLKLTVKKTDDKPVAERRKSQQASMKRLSMPSNKVLSTAVEVKKTVTERRKSQIASSKRLSMPGNSSTLSVAPSKKVVDTAERRKSQVKVKRLSMPAQNTKTLSVAVSKRKSLINVIPKDTVKKVEAKKVETVKKVESTKKVETTKVESAKKLGTKKVESAKKVEPKKVESTKKVEPIKKSTKKSPVNKPETKISTETSPSYHTPEAIITTRSTRSSTRNIPDFKLYESDSFNRATRGKSVNVITQRRSFSQVKSVEKKQENVKTSVEVTKKSQENTSPNNKRDLRSKSRGKSEDKSMKRKRSLSEAPIATPNKKNKTTPSQVTNDTPRSGFIVTPSRRQLLLTPRASMGTSKTSNGTPKSTNAQRSPKSQPITPRRNNRAALMVQTCLDQQEKKQPVIDVGVTDIFRVGHSVAVQTVDPSNILSDYDKLRIEEDSSSEEEETETVKTNKFKKQMNELKQSVKGGCIVM